MFEEIEDRLVDAFEEALASRFEIKAKVMLEQPKQTSFGELAIPVAFQLARQLKRAPKQIAEELTAAVGEIPGIKSFEIAGNGFINARLARDAYAQNLLNGTSKGKAKSAAKMVVEHTNINPNKAAHIGHLRNAVLGDTFVRMLRQRFESVEVQNYIDNTGVQVADVVAGFHFLEGKTGSDVRASIADQGVRFDYLCWDLYARVSSYYKEHSEAMNWRTETLHAIEADAGELAEIGHVVANAIVRAHVATMLRLDIQYDLLPRESEILHLKFWAYAFELLKERKAIYFEEEGKNKGCWVMPASAFRQGSEDAKEEGEAEDSKVIVRSNGTVTYVGKDIAYQLWKFGLLGKDFYYRLWSVYPNKQPLWVTASTPAPGTANGTAQRFGHADKVYNVIDARQSYLQDVVVAGLRALDFQKQADASVHFSYEMVALSPRACIEMGIQLSEEDRKRPYIEVSGRRGLGVKADDLIDRLTDTAFAEVKHRHPEFNADELAVTARQIAVGALRYFLLKYTRNSVIAFDFQEALSFEGETGPYAQYAGVRAQNILRKWIERGEEIPDFKTSISETALRSAMAEEDIWQLVLIASKSGTAVERAIQSGEPAHVAKYAFQLAQAFNNFYHEHNVLAEPDAERRVALLWVTDYVRSRLEATLSILGIEQPAYM